mmetsp:Transcript_23208/g.58537  ORF Transcript_23208/g.58537 Transcript_23208/m.58537 type:complete len:338 (-) Transcript_23208:272-1285(-)
MASSLSSSVMRPCIAPAREFRASRPSSRAPVGRRGLVRASAAPVEYAGLSQDQVEFMERSRMSKGLPPLLGAGVTPAASPTARSAPAAAPSDGASASSSIKFLYAPISDFAVDQLTPKGPRKNTDWGTPEDFTRALQKGSISVGSWACTEGGWNSPTARPTTEAFYVLSGHGCVTDPDGTQHPFGPGDTVVLPKHWYGRWDIQQRIRKVWLTLDHADVPGAAKTPEVMSLAELQAKVGQLKVRQDALHGSSPAQGGAPMYNVGPTSAGYWTCTPGSWASSKKETEMFFVLEGVFFLTNADGSARRCGPGDTVVLPKGWSGHWDIIETVKKVWFIVKH